MKYVKILGLLAVATTAMMSFAAGASADYVSTTTGGAAATPNIHWVSEGHMTLKNPIANISCASTIAGNVESHGAGFAVSGSVSTLTFTGCTNSWHVTVTTNGSFAISAASGHNGWLSSTGAKIDTTRFGITCVYKTSLPTTLGFIDGGNPATVRINAWLTIESLESSALCGKDTTGFLEGSYSTTSALYIADS